MSEAELVPGALERITRARRAALAVGAIACAISVLGAFLDLKRFFESYLFSFLFVSELTLGSMAMLMCYHLTGGRWGAGTRRILEAATRTIYACAALFVPLLFGITRLYSWADPSERSIDPKLAHKALYLNPLSFSVRALAYFAGWIFLATSLDRLSRGQEKGADPEVQARLRSLSAGGLVFLGFSVTFASIDWQMSLEPHWYSTVYGMIFGAGQALGAWAFVVLVFTRLARGAEERVRFRNEVRFDMGNILLTTVMVWAYLSFVQYLIIWCGNMPEELKWYARRTDHGWQWVAVILMVFQFAAPFALLLFRGVKKRRAAMTLLCALILAVRLVDRYWFVMPGLHPDRIPLSWLDFSLLLGLGGLWLWAFLGYLAERPLFAVNDPDWEEARVEVAHA